MNLYPTCPDNNFKTTSPQGGKFCVIRVKAIIKVQNRNRKSDHGFFGKGDITDQTVDCLQCETGKRIMKEHGLKLGNPVNKYPICPGCGYRRKHAAHGLCVTCYAREYNKAKREEGNEQNTD